MVSWNITTWINKQKMPDPVSSRLDMIFYTKSFEIGNGEVKLPNTLKAVVDLARIKVLETCKRQLHVRLMNAASLKEAVTFGILVYGLSYEIYLVTFNDGYYSYERISVGLLSSPYTTYRCIEKRLVLIQFKSFARKVGNVTDWSYAVALQDRGSPHVHLVLWTGNTTEELLAMLDLVVAQIPHQE